MAKLLPCPFCGGSKLRYLTDLDVGMKGDYDIGINGEFIKCLECGAMVGRYANMDIIEAQEKAIKAWNRRYLEEPKESLVYPPGTEL